MLSCDFFILVLKKVTCMADVNTKGTIFDKPILPLGYTNDINILQLFQQAILISKSQGTSVLKSMRTVQINAVHKQKISHGLGQSITTDSCNFEVRVVQVFIFLDVNMYRFLVWLQHGLNSI